MADSGSTSSVGKTGDPNYKGTDTLKMGDTLHDGQYILSADGRFRVQVQDGKLVEYGPDGGKPLWIKDISGDHVTV